MKKLIALFIAVIICALPATAAANTTLSVQSVAPGGIPAYTNPLFPATWAGRMQYSFCAQGGTGGTTLTNIGNAPSITGTASNVSTTAGDFFNYVTTATTVGSFCGITNAVTTSPYLLSYKPRFMANILIGPNSTDLTNGNIQVGLVNNSGGSLTTPGVYVGYDPVVDANVHLYCCTQTAGANTRTDTGISLTTSSNHTIYIDATVSGTVTFVVDGQTFVNTTNVPAASQAVEAVILNTITTAGTNINIGVNSWGTFDY